MNSCFGDGFVEVEKRDDDEEAAPKEKEEWETRSDETGLLGEHRLTISFDALFRFKE